jgi:hypothetical protein
MDDETSFTAAPEWQSNNSNFLMNIQDVLLDRKL